MDYFEPSTTDEALELLDRYAGRAQLIAGGTDVLLDIKAERRPDCLVNIKRIPGLDVIAEAGDGVDIGPLVTIRQLQESALIRDRLPLLWSSACQFASLQIRTTATVGGNCSRASPSGDTLAPLLALDAEVGCLLPGGAVRMPIREFFRGPGRTALDAAGVLTAIHVPWPPQPSAARYLKHAVRGPMDIAIVGVAVQLSADADGERIADVRIGLAAVAPTPVRATGAEELLAGQVPDAALLDSAGDAAAAASSPIDDQRASAAHRRLIVAALARRGVAQCWQELTGREVG